MSQSQEEKDQASPAVVAEEKLIVPVMVSIGEPDATTTGIGDMMSESDDFILSDDDDSDMIELVSGLTTTEDELGDGYDLGLSDKGFSASTISITDHDDGGDNGGTEQEKRREPKKIANGSKRTAAKKKSVGAANKKEKPLADDKLYLDLVGRIPGGGGGGGGGGGAGIRNQQQQRQQPNSNSKMQSQQKETGAAGTGTSNFICNWGHRSNLVDKNGQFQRAAGELTHYIAIYKARYFFYFDLVNGRYPQFVRKFDNGMEIWRMSFNIYSSGFMNLIVHLGEIHAFYQMEFVDGQLQWVYKDFNFYPNKMRYGFRVNSYDIADIYSRFIKFVCLKNNLLKSFPNVNINHKYYIKHKFEENLRAMKNRLNEVTITDAEATAERNGTTTTSGEQPSTAHQSAKAGDHDPAGGSGRGQKLRSSDKRQVVDGAERGRYSFNPAAANSDNRVLRTSFRQFRRGRGGGGLTGRGGCRLATSPSRMMARGRNFSTIGSVSGGTGGRGTAAMANYRH